MRLVHGAQDDRYLIEKPAMIAAPPASLAKHEPQGQPHQNDAAGNGHPQRSEEHTSELQSLRHLVCRLLLEKKNKKHTLQHTQPISNPRESIRQTQPDA